MRWGLIGASTIASQHVIGAIRATGGTVVAVMSTHQARAEDFATAHGIGVALSQLDDLLTLPGIAAVYISSTNEKHFAQTMAALNAGKHVLCEKPLAMTTGQAAEMVALADGKGLVLATNHHLRCSGSHRAIRDLVASGRIGKVLSLRIFHAVHLPQSLQGWRINDAAVGGGVIPDITVHDADVARFILGEDPLTVVAQAGTSGLGQGVEDSAMSIWTMPSGAMVQSHESFTHPFAGSGLELHGTLGSVFARGVMTQVPLGEIELVTAAGREAIPFPTHDLYAQGLQDFQAAVAGLGSPAATGQDGVASLAVALAVREAARTGTRQTVDYGKAA
jgi:1,5-anhydro-D-fructose reductase (1,5-anhydro-D-mannitol-forming)